VGKTAVPLAAPLVVGAPAGLVGEAPGVLGTQAAASDSVTALPTSRRKRRRLTSAPSAHDCWRSCSRSMENSSATCSGASVPLSKVAHVSAPSRPPDRAAGLDEHALPGFQAMNVALKARAEAPVGAPASAVRRQ
jgi:hypothetical protein